MDKKIIALFGGTFDPIHLGHTAIASTAAEYIGADKVIFIPAKRSPLKTLFPQAGDNDRREMIAFAIADNKKFELSDYELNKPTPSYTLETVRYFQTEYGGGTSLYWLIGADCVNELPYWHRIDELIDECKLSVVYRAGCETPDFSNFADILGKSRTEKLQQNIIPTPLIDISSSEIRKRLSSGLDTENMLHPAVTEYIRKHNLYRSKIK